MWLLYLTSSSILCVNDFNVGKNDYREFPRYPSAKKSNSLASPEIACSVAVLTWNIPLPNNVPQQSGWDITLLTCEDTKINYICLLFSYI